MKHLSLETVRAFVTAIDLGSISSTAEQLGKSQPAISLQIKRLEEQLGKSLLIRRHRKIQLSNSGLKIYELCKQLLVTNDQIIAQLEDEPLAGRIKLGIPSEFASTLLPNIVGRFAQAYPNIALEVICDLSKNLTSEKRSGDYDLVLALHDKPNARRKGLVRSDQLVWVGKQGWPHEDIKELPLVLAQDGCLYRKRALKLLAQYPKPSRIVHTNPDLSGIQAAIIAGLGVTVLAKSTVPDSLKTVDPSKLELPELGYIDISLQYNRREAGDSVHKLADFIRSSLM